MVKRKRGQSRAFHHNRLDRVGCDHVGRLSRDKLDGFRRSSTHARAPHSMSQKDRKPASQAHERPRVLSATMSMAQMIMRVLSLSVFDCRDTTPGCWGGYSVPAWEAPYEILVRLCRAVSRRDLVNCLTVQQHGNVAAYTNLLAPGRLDRGAEGKTSCCAAAGADDRDLPPPRARLINRSNGVVRTGLTVGEACQARERSPQLQRRLRNKLQGRQCPLGRL
jgi:hypothetical protein